MIEYVPGKLNMVADMLSHAEYPRVLPDEPEFKARAEEKPFDQEQWLLKTVPGDPGSLCDCLMAVLGLSAAKSSGLIERRSSRSFSINQQGMGSLARLAIAIASKL